MYDNLTTDLLKNNSMFGRAHDMGPALTEGFTQNELLNVVCALMSPECVVNFANSHPGFKGNDGLMALAVINEDEGSPKWLKYQKYIDIFDGNPFSAAIPVGQYLEEYIQNAPNGTATDAKILLAALRALSENFEDANRLLKESLLENINGSNVEKYETFWMQLAFATNFEVWLKNNYGLALIGPSAFNGKTRDGKVAENTNDQKSSCVVPSAKAYYFNYVPIPDAFKNSEAEAIAVINEVCKCLPQVFAQYGMPLSDIYLCNDIEKKPNEIKYGQGHTDPYGKYFTSLRFALTNDHKLIVDLGREKFSDENSNAEIITDIRKAFVEHLLITESEQPKVYDDPYAKKSGGCYVATAVYGSYDCPQVWTLRRYRDYSLATTWYGRLFIKTYYAVSPTIVKWFGKTKWFNMFWKSKLDKMVARLNGEGFEDTPYND